MAKATSLASRVRITENGAALRVIVPPRRNWLILLFGPFWLVGWTVGAVVVPMSFFSGAAGNTPFGIMLVWFCGWMAGGIWLLLNWFWNAKGREEVSVRDDAFCVRYSVFEIGRTWEFDPCAVRDLRVICPVHSPPAWFDWSAYYAIRRKQGYWSQTSIWEGPFAFDYGARTYRFGAGMDEAEARALLPLLLRRLSPGEGR